MTPMISLFVTVRDRDLGQEMKMKRFFAAVVVIFGHFLVNGTVCSGGND